MTPKQARAARAVLDWSVRRLAQESGVSESSIRRIEAEPVTLDIRARLQKFYEGLGFGFWFADGAQGVGWQVPD